MVSAIPAPILCFEGDHAFLSSFYPSPIDWQGLLFPTVEHAYQAAKCRDVLERRRFICGVAADIKQLGQTVSLRPDWDEVKPGVMLDLVRRTFEIPALARRLLATGRADSTMAELALDERAKRYTNVTLLLTPEEAEAMVLATQMGRLHLTLRAEDDDEVQWKAANEKGCLLYTSRRG